MGSTHQNWCWPNRSISFLSFPFQPSELTELPVVENSQLFAQRAHSACTAHGTPPLRGAFLVLVLPGSCGMVKDQGPLGGNLTMCWAAEMEGNQVASLNLGWQKR